MNKTVYETEEMNVPMLEIEMQDEMEHLVAILSNNGYEVQVTPVYETLEELKATGCRTYNRMRPRIKYYSIKILGFIEKPKYND